jgi:hypothetical protein
MLDFLNTPTRIDVRDSERSCWERWSESTSAPDAQTQPAASEIFRTLFVLTPAEGRLTVDLYGDLAGILGVAAQKNGPLDASDPLVRQVKLVAGAEIERDLLFGCRA